MSEELGAVEETGVTSPEPQAPSVLTTSEGQFVAGLARVVSLAQCLGLMLLFGMLVRYHSQVSDDLILGGLGTHEHEVTAEFTGAAGPAILLVPVLAALVAFVSWGLWHLKPWARRIALLMCVLLVVGGVVSAHWAQTGDEPVVLDDSGLDDIGAFEDTTDMLKAATILAGFYGIILGLLLLPTVGRVFRLANEENSAAEKRFTIGSDEPRDHFQVQHQVDQL